MKRSARRRDPQYDPLRVQESRGSPEGPDSVLGLMLSTGSVRLASLVGLACLECDRLPPRALVIEHEDWRTEAGSTVHQIVANDQNRKGAWGFMRRMEFQPDGRHVYVKTNSPSGRSYITNSRNQLVLDLEPWAADLPASSSRRPRPRRGGRAPRLNLPGSPVTGKWSCGSCSARHPAEPGWPLPARRLARLDRSRCTTPCGYD